MAGPALSRIGILTAGIGLAGLMAAGGIIYQIVAEKADLRRYPPPGRMVDIGGRRLHLLCKGDAAGPTVVIEAGAGHDSTLWGDILRPVSRFARTCAYDRAGLGWSDPAPGPRSIADRADDLHALLAAAAIPGPYILVAHSYGGFIVRWFARRYPGEVAGIALVDATEEGFSFAPAGLAYAAEVRDRERRIGWATRLGLLRLGVALFPDRIDPVRGVPPEARGEMTALVLRTSRHFATADELAAYETVPPAMRRPAGFGLLGDLPVVVISRGAHDPATGQPTLPEWLAAQDRLTALSTNSRRIVADKSGHLIQFGQPGLIVDAIRRLWDETRR